MGAFSVGGATIGLNAGLAAATRLLGIRNDPYTCFNFFVELGGLVVGGFSEVTGLTIETEITDYREGGMNEYLHRLPGPTKYPANLVLKHGLTDIDSMFLWHQDVVSGTVKRRSGSIYVLDRARLPAMWWNFTDAYPVKWVGPELKAEQNLIAFESIELVHRGISKPALSRALSYLRAAAGATSDVIRTARGGFAPVVQDIPRTAVGGVQSFL